MNEESAFRDYDKALKHLLSDAVQEEDDLRQAWDMYTGPAIENLQAVGGKEALYKATHLQNTHNNILTSFRGEIA